MTSISDREHDATSRFLKVHGNTWSAIPAILYLIAVWAFIKNHYALLDFPLDDAWIHQVYSRSFAFGHGFAYNAGQQEAGSTSPLWAIVTAPAHWLEWLGTDVVVFAVKLVGVILGLICVVAVQRMASRLIGSERGGGITASLFAVDPKLLFSALSGMETCLLVAILVGACLMLVEKRPLFFIMLIGLAPVARPEALLLLPCSLFGIALILRTNRGILLKTVVCFVPLLPMAIWAGFCFLATGHLLPNTFFLKAQPFSLGIPGVTIGFSAMIEHGLVPAWVLLAGLCAFGFLCLKRKVFAVPPFVFLVLAPIAYILGVVGSRRIVLEGYYWTRWIDPAALLITAAFCMGCGFVLTQALNPEDMAGKVAMRQLPKPKLLISVIGLVVLLMSAPTFLASFTDRRNHLASDSRAIAIINVMMGTWIAENTPTNAIVGVNDAGAIRYFGQRRTIDLLGLNDADIAFGKTTIQEAIAGTDWLAIFPQWFNQRGSLNRILQDFEPCVSTTIPLEEYTVCNAPSQTQLVAFRRKALIGSPGLPR